MVEAMAWAALAAAALEAVLAWEMTAAKMAKTSPTPSSLMPLTLASCGKKEASTE